MMGGVCGMTGVCVEMAGGEDGRVDFRCGADLPR